MLQDIIIIGPTSAGKTSLANMLATHLSLPVLNCDAVQMYKDLNLLTNKPEFKKKENDIFYTEPVYTMEFDENFSIKVISNSQNLLNKPPQVNNPKQFIIKEFQSFLEFLEFLKQNTLFNEKIEQSGKLVENYLFDQISPLERADLAFYLNRLKWIVENNNFNSRIIVGGTVYYALHYILGTFLPSSQEDRNCEDHGESLEILLGWLERHDPESLKFIDKTNRQRVMKAVNFFKTTGEKYSTCYRKDQNLLQDFMVILLYPKDMQQYYKKLDTVVSSRITPEAFEEIDNLEKKYGKKILNRLDEISYEYKFARQIKDVYARNENYDELLQKLQFAEHHYAKRQITFMKKLERELLTMSRE